jgi:hypothetical protein
MKIILSIFAEIVVIGILIIDHSIVQESEIDVLFVVVKPNIPCTIVVHVESRIQHILVTIARLQLDTQCRCHRYYRNVALYMYHPRQKAGQKRDPHPNTMCIIAKFV